MLFGGTVCLLSSLWVLIDFSNYEVLFEKLDIVAFSVVSCGVVLFGALGLLALWQLERGSVWMLKLHLLWLVLVCILKLLVFTLIIVWTIDSFTVETNVVVATGALEADGGVTEEVWYHTGWEWLDEAMDESFLRFNGFSCQAYRECCWVYPQRNLPTAEREAGCMSVHGGATTGTLTNAKRDPSHASFCELVTSYKGDRYAGKQAQCHVYEGLDIVDLAECAPCPALFSCVGRQCAGHWCMRHTSHPLLQVRSVVL
jgi:hypothetical protein